MRNTTAAQPQEMNMELSSLQLEAVIWDINWNLPDHRQCVGGDFPSSYFGIRGDWIAHIESNGHIEIAACFSKSGRPVVIAIDQ